MTPLNEDDFKLIAMYFCEITFHFPVEISVNMQWIFLIYYIHYCHTDNPIKIRPKLESGYF